MVCKQLLQDANCKPEGIHRLVIALPCALADQGQRSGTCALRAKEKPAQTAGAGSRLIWRQKLVALWLQEDFIDAADPPPVTGCGIFLQFDGDLCAALHLN